MPDTYTPPPKPGQLLARGVCRHLASHDFVTVEELIPTSGLRVDVMALGPKGEIWNVMEDLPPLLEGCASILAPNANFMILSAYAIRASFFMTHELMCDKLGDRNGTLTSGELILKQADERRMSTSLFSRWEA